MFAIIIIAPLVSSSLWRFLRHGNCRREIPWNLDSYGSCQGYYFQFADPRDVDMSMRKMHEILLKLKPWIFILPVIWNRRPDVILISLHAFGMVDSRLFLSISDSNRLSVYDRNQNMAMRINRVVIIIININSLRTFRNRPLR